MRLSKTLDLGGPEACFCCDLVDLVDAVFQILLREMLTNTAALQVGRVIPVVLRIGNKVKW